MPTDFNAWVKKLCLIITCLEGVRSRRPTVDLVTKALLSWPANEMVGGQALTVKVVNHFIMVIVLMACDCNVYHIYFTLYFFTVVGPNNEVNLTNERNFDITKFSRKKSKKTSLFRPTSVHLMIVWLVCRTNCSDMYKDNQHFKRQFCRFVIVWLRPTSGLASRIVIQYNRAPLFIFLMLKLNLSWF